MLKGNKLLLALLLPVFLLALSFSAIADFEGEHLTPEQIAEKMQAMEIEKLNPYYTPVEGDLAVQTDAVQPDKANCDGGFVAIHPSGEACFTPPMIQDNGTLLPPVNDDCVDAIEITTWPSAITGTCVDATIDCPGLLDWNAVWYKFTLTEMSDIFVDYCNTVDSIYSMGIIIMNDCACDDYVIADSYTWTCANGNGEMEFLNVPAGTWYFPAMVVDWDELPMGFDVYFDKSASPPPPDGRCCYGDPAAPSCMDTDQFTCEALSDFLSWNETLDCTTPCPVVGVGDNCANPIAVTLSGSDYSDANYTCGRVNDYTESCLGSYDGGEDIIYEVTVTTQVYVDIELDPQGTTWSGFYLAESCGDASTCVGYVTNSGSTPYGLYNQVIDPGTYYIMVDTWPSPDCIPSFTLDITDLGTPPAAPANDDCADAETVVWDTQMMGTTLGATVDCPGVLDWNAVWYTFDLDQCYDVTVKFCGTTPDLETVGVAVFPDCTCGSYTLHTNTTWDECPGDGNPTSYYNGLETGTYYYPVFTGDGNQQDFVIEFERSVCPLAPANDDCADAEVIPGPFPATITGTTVGATLDCPGVLDWNAVWYTFDAPYASNNITIDYCGSSPDLETVGVVLFEDCSCGAYILHSNTTWNECGGADGNPTSYFNGVAGGTYYYPAFTGPGTYGGIQQDFTLTIDIQEQLVTPGDNCSDPFVIDITGPGDLPYTDANYTCGRINDYENTCLSYYDGGEDIIYELNLDVPMNLKFTMDPLGTTWNGIVLSTTCPDMGSTYDDCFAYAKGTSGGPKVMQVVGLPAGTYYIMVDTWPSPDCIPAFNLTIESFVINPGDFCADPLKINLPADIPYNTTDATCGRGNAESNTCLSSYDGGEDIFYEVNVDDAGYFEFILDPMGTSYTGMALSDACPPSGTYYDDCLAEAHGSSGLPKGFVTYLEPGTYYLMIDTWPSPDCIPNFGLTINELAPPELAYDQTLIEFCNVQLGDNGCATLNLSNLGDIDLEFDFDITYGFPPAKEIDGANIITTGSYVPGTTADVTFTISNASDDAEWLDEFTMTFPAGVTVNSADDVVGSSGNLVWDGTTGDGVTCTWTCDDPPYGCMYSDDVETFTMNLTFDAGLSGPLNVDYTISGDDWGDPPHDVSGSLQLPEDNPYTTWLSVDTETGTVPGGGNMDIQVCFDTQAFTVGGLYFGALVLFHNGGLSPITIPVTLSIGPDHDDASVLLIDRSGSMALTDAFGDPRLERAKALAHNDLTNIQAASDGGSPQMAAVMTFSSDGIIVIEDFTDDFVALHDAIDAIVNPRHDTPLAAAMCQAHCNLTQLGCGVDYIYTYTDGEENQSMDYDMCVICDACYHLHSTGWNYDCDPSNPASCTDWQMCLSDVFANNAINIVNYFGSPINPFAKGSAPTEDLFFLKYTAETSDGEFNYYPDAAFIPGDANGDSSIDVSDAVFIVNYAFAGGDAPDPIGAADANCDEAVDVSDAVYIINFAFAGGQAPADCSQ